LFDCIECSHEFLISPNNITNKKSWCPYCQNKTETKFLKWFNETFPDILISYQAKFEWCKSELNRYLPFDFCIDSMKLIIEIDGPQHFIQISNWKSPEETRTRDKYKENLAIENGYVIFRILQEDIWYNRNDWETTVKDFISLLGAKYTPCA
jgi:very-short-patch-repair endonuclease